jgi:hypothetical protein
MAAPSGCPFRPVCRQDFPGRSVIQAPVTIPGGFVTSFTAGSAPTCPLQRLSPVRAGNAVSPRRPVLSCSWRVLQSLAGMSGIAVSVGRLLHGLSQRVRWPPRDFRSRRPRHKKSWWRGSSRGLGSASEYDPDGTASFLAASHGVPCPFSV